MGRAECLAAVALVVGARRDAVTALRALAAADPSLRRLNAIADRCAAGVALPAALAAAGLIQRREVSALTGLIPSALAGELKRLARIDAVQPLGEILANWFPVWAILAASVPSLIIGAAVALLGSALYGGVWQSLGFGEPHHDSPLWWLAEAFTVGVACSIAGLGWWLLRTLSGWLTAVPFFVPMLPVFSFRLMKATAAADLIHALRAGDDGKREFTIWARLSGDRRAVQRMDSTCGGDHAATVIALGLVPLGADCRPDWDAAQAESERIRALEAADLAPWMIAVLAVVGVYGFLDWQTLQLAWMVDSWPLLSEWSTAFGYDLNRIVNSWHYDHFSDHAFQIISLGIIPLLATASVAVLIMHIVRLFARIGCLVSGPAYDWPLVADRLARAIEQKLDLNRVLSGLRLLVSAPMRRRLDAAGRRSDAHPGLRLSAAGVIPHALARGISHAEVADLPALLRNGSTVGDRHRLQGLTSRFATVMTLGLLLAFSQWWVFITMYQHFAWYLPLFITYGELIKMLSVWSLRITVLSFCIMLVVGLIVAWGRRRGWWQAAHGFANLSRGLVLHRLLSVNADEARIARTIAAITPRRAARLDDAARRGDLPGLLAAAGWPVSSPAALDRALTAAVITGERKRRRLELFALLAMPFVAGIPVGLTVVTFFLLMLLLPAAYEQFHQRLPLVPFSDFRATSTGLTIRPISLGGGTPGMALLYWGTLRYELEGDNAVAARREDLQDFQPLPPGYETLTPSPMPQQPPLPHRSTPAAAKPAPSTAHTLMPPSAPTTTPQAARPAGHP